MFKFPTKNPAAPPITLAPFLVEITSRICPPTPVLRVIRAVPSRLGAREGRYAGREIVCGHRNDGVFVLIGKNGGRRLVGSLRIESFRERSADGRAVLSKTNQRGREAREMRAGAQNLHHRLGLRLAIDGHRSVQKEMPTVLVVGLHEVHQLHVGGVATQFLAEDPRDQRNLVRRQRDGPCSADLESRLSAEPTRSMAVSPSPRTSISWTSSGRAVVEKDWRGVS